MSISIVVENVEYNSISKLAKEYGMSRQQLNYRYHKGLRGKELVNVNRLNSISSSPIVVNDFTYKSLSHLSRATGISLPTLKNRYNKGLRNSELTHKSMLYDEYIDYKKQSQKGENK